MTSPNFHQTNGRKTPRVEMTDITLEQSPEEVLKVVNHLIDQLQTLSNAVPAVDLRALSRLKLSFLKKNLTEDLLKVCITKLLKSSDSGASLNPITPDFLLTSLGGGLQTGNPLDDPLVEKVLSDFAPKSPEQFPETGFFFAILVLDFLIKKPNSEAECARFVTQLVVQLGNLNRRTLDFFASKIYAFFGRVVDDCEIIRNDLLAIYRTACLRRDAGIQATLLNLILRNYLKYSLHEQASQFVAKTTFPEIHTNAEFARYLFYIGKMRSIQMQYTESHSKLMQALRKAPQGTTKAMGFKILAKKFAITVELLMGEIPERREFLQEGMLGNLKPYEDVAKSVRGGSIPQFEKVVKENEALFKKDTTFTLINRLRYNVIKTGLRKVNFSYSRISLVDVAAKLGLECPEDAAGISSKAIADGVIEGSLDYDAQTLLSGGRKDVYSTDEPQQQLHKRIAFCLQLHNDCVRSMEYPSKEEMAAEDDPSRANREMAELIAEVEDDIEML